MAVRAQHSSGIFFLSRNGQEGNDCSLQPQKPHFPFTNGETGLHTTKRAREAAAAPMNPPPPQDINLTELPNRRRRRQPPNVVSACDRHGHLQHCSNGEQMFLPLSALSGDLAGEIKRQSDEVDRFLRTQDLQGERLRCTLADGRERHYRELLSAAEELVARKLKEKDAEMEKATRRKAELEARAAQLAADARVWQVRAAAREAEAATLQARLQQATAAEGGGGTEEAEDAESVNVDPDRVGRSCRICRRRSATVVALPCRHLCVCTECDGAARACPLCLSLKSSSVEVFFS